MTARPELRNVVSGLCVALLGAAALVAAGSLPTGRPAAADPGLLPRVVGIGLVGVGIALVLVAALRWWRGVETRDDAEGLPVDLPVDVPDELLEPETGGRPDWGQVGGFALLALLYPVGAFRLGFVTSTVLFIVGGALVLGRRRNARSLIVLAIFAVAVAAAYDFGFFTLLNVREPDTPLP